LALAVVSKGVPYAVAMNMDEGELLGHHIIFGEVEGGTWDWSRMEWEKPG
jgi:hypothetical protein